MIGDRRMSRYARKSDDEQASAQYRPHAFEPPLRRTRSGKPCMAPAVSGEKRCRMHGGAPGSGAPPANKNALKHGRYTRVAFEERRQLRALLQQSRMLLRQIE
jgi:hypothetical protein